MMRDIHTIFAYLWTIWNHRNLVIQDAWTQLPGQRTRVRRGGTRRRGRDATDRASMSRHATWRFPNRADAAQIGANAAQIGLTRSVSACIGRNGRVRSKFKKKKKKVQMHRLTNLNTQTPLRPSHFVQNSQTPSLTPSLISLLCVLRPSSLFSVF